MKTTTIFLNMKTSQGVETVDQFTQGEDSPSNWREFKRYVSQMIREYRISGMSVYSSNRSTKQWKQAN